MKRRTFLHLAAGAVTLPAVSSFAWAQGYAPSGPPSMIYPAVVLLLLAGFAIYHPLSTTEPTYFCRAHI
jgi:hypothetical protein